MQPRFGAESAGLGSHCAAWGNLAQGPAIQPWCLLMTSVSTISAACGVKQDFLGFCPSNSHNFKAAVSIEKYFVF